MVIVPSPVKKSPPPAFVSGVSDLEKDSLDTNMATMNFTADSSDSDDEKDSEDESESGVTL